MPILIAYTFYKDTIYARTHIGILYYIFVTANIFYILNVIRVYTFRRRAYSIDLWLKYSIFSSVPEKKMVASREYRRRSGGNRVVSLFYICSRF